MSGEKKLNSRIQQKHDIEANWIKATNFIPLLGEMIIYDAEIENVTQLPKNTKGENIRDNWITYVRIKIGDGKTLVTDLPFFATESRMVAQIITWEADD